MAVTGGASAAPAFMVVATVPYTEVHAASTSEVHSSPRPFFSVASSACPTTSSEQDIKQKRGIAG